jgi:K+ transporter
LLLLKPDIDPERPYLFFLMAPSWGLLPLVGIATAAAIIASQALI